MANAISIRQKSQVIFKESPIHQIHFDKEGLEGCHIGREG